MRWIFAVRSLGLCSIQFSSKLGEVLGEGPTLLWPHPFRLPSGVLGGLRGSFNIPGRERASDCRKIARAWSVRVGIDGRCRASTGGFGERTPRTIKLIQLGSGPFLQAIGNTIDRLCRS